MLYPKAAVQNDLRIDARSLAVGYALFGASSRSGDGDGDGDGDGEGKGGRRGESRDRNPIDDRASGVAYTIGGEPASVVLARVRAGDQSALTLIYDTLFHTLWRIAMLRLRATQAAEEVVQDVFLSFWVRRASLRTDLDLRVYLAAAVRNRTRDVQAHERVVQSMEMQVSRATVAPPAIGQGMPVADVVLETNEFWEAYRRALRTLTEREREGVLLRWEEEFTLEQVGRVLGMSTMGARALILRAQRKVQMALADYRV